MADCTGDDKPFVVERAKTGRAKCRKCKCPIEKDTVRLAKIQSNPFGDGLIKAWHHVTCLFEVFSKQRPQTKKIDDPLTDVGGWEDLSDQDKELVWAELKNAAWYKTPPGKQQGISKDKIAENFEARDEQAHEKKQGRSSDSKPVRTKLTERRSSKGQNSSIEKVADNLEIASEQCSVTKDDMFREFRRLCADIANISAYTEKTELIRNMFTHGSQNGGHNVLVDSSEDEKPIITLDVHCLMFLVDFLFLSGARHPEAIPGMWKRKKERVFFILKLLHKASKIAQQTPDTLIVINSSGTFQGDVLLWCRMLLPGVTKRIYNLQNKQLIKLFSRLFSQDENEMLEHLEQGDVAETVRYFFESSDVVRPNRQSVLTLKQVDQFLENLSKLTREDDQVQHFASIAERCTSNDLKMIVRLIKHDLRINAGPKHILEAIHEEAYKAFQVSMDLNAVISRFVNLPSSNTSNASSSNLASPSISSKATVVLMTPVLPMLAESCTSVEMAMKKCPLGMLSEVKYDGERVQVHKRGSEFRYYSRSLKPVMLHKINHFKDYIPKAFPSADDLILDSEILMIDTKTGQPLPFGTLGVHKRAQFKDANVCLFVFDCLYYNGDVLIDQPMLTRRKILEEKMTPIPNRIQLSQIEEVHDRKTLAEMIMRALKMGLEGLVLKDITGKYEPGKRHWLKVKKDYLFEGAMADSADLVVLGAWYGTGQKGGMMSIFLMGCYDEQRDCWLTVTKVHTGHDDATLAQLQNELDMVKISKDPDLLPKWLKANKPMIPDFVAKDPKKQPVWEITGAEFTNQGVHTADGISIRFPRVTRIRHDKDWKTATSLAYLRILFKRSSESMDFSLLLGNTSNEDKLEIKPGTLNIFAGTSTTSVTDSTRQTMKSINGANKRKERYESEEESAETSMTELKKMNEKKIKSEKKYQIDFMTTSSSKLQAGNSMQNENTDKPIEKIEPNFYQDIKVKQESPSSLLVYDLSTDSESEAESEDHERSEYYTYMNRSRCLGFSKDVRAILAPDIEGSKRAELHKKLKSLGVTVLEKKNRSMATHVIHQAKTIRQDESEIFRDYGKEALHVYESWVEESAKQARPVKVEPHAVILLPFYCSCRHPQL